jgi:hypothetical protein
VLLRAASHSSCVTFEPVEETANITEGPQRLQLTHAGATLPWSLCANYEAYLAYLPLMLLSVTLHFWLLVVSFLIILIFGMYFLIADLSSTLLPLMCTLAMTGLIVYIVTQHLRAVYFPSTKILLGVSYTASSKPSNFTYLDSLCRLQGLQSAHCTVAIHQLTPPILLKLPTLVW